jgi:UDP-galactopyranose mutase
MKYDFLIVGSGFFGSICAYELNKIGFKVCVIDKRNHIGGNCYTSHKDGINIHEYGPHIFHTNDENIWNWINQFIDFNHFRLSPVANYKGELFSLPFNMWTFNKLWGTVKPDDVIKKISEQSSEIITPKNLEEQAIKSVGKDVYEKLIKGYTQKQWMKNPKELPSEIIKRLPVRLTFDNNYFNDKFQGIPIGGYTKIFEKLLNSIDVKLNFDFFDNNNLEYDNLIYTGPIDQYFGFKFGPLEYKTTNFKHELLNIENYQGCAIMNFTDLETRYTRIIEHKHFEFLSNDKTWITKEYPTEYIPLKTEPYYPVNDILNNEKYLKYKNEGLKLSNVYFGGRLGEYKYYDMHQIISSALSFVNKIKNK